MECYYHGTYRVVLLSMVIKNSKYSIIGVMILCMVIKNSKYSIIDIMYGYQEF